MQGSEGNLRLALISTETVRCDPVKNYLDALNLRENDALIVKLIAHPAFHVGQINLAEEGDDDQVVDVVCVHAVDSRNFRARFKRESKKTFRCRKCLFCAGLRRGRGPHRE